MGTKLIMEVFYNKLDCGARDEGEGRNVDVAASPMQGYSLSLNRVPLKRQRCAGRLYNLFFRSQSREGGLGCIYFRKGAKASVAPIVVHGRMVAAAIWLPKSLFGILFTNKTYTALRLECLK